MAVVFAQVVIIATLRVYINNIQNGIPSVLKVPTGTPAQNINNKTHSVEDGDKCDKSSLERSRKGTVLV